MLKWGGNRQSRADPYHRTTWRNTSQSHGPFMTIWVRTNPRPFLAALCAVALVSVGLVLVAAFAWNVIWLRWVLGTLIFVSLAYSVWLVWQARLPRVGLKDEKLLLFLTASRAIPVPLEHVECFLLGQGPTFLGKSKSETATLSIRIAERATEFQQQNVLRFLASWCNGYVTIRGTWTEPLTVDLVRRLNSQLADAKEITA